MYYVEVSRYFRAIEALKNNVVIRNTLNIVVCIVYLCIRS